jgi:hypothetical protein
LGVGGRFAEISSNHVPRKEGHCFIDGGKDVTSPKIKYFGNSNLLENYSIFSKFEFGKKFPFMEISNFEFDKL